MFMARLGHGIGVYLLMVHLGLVGNLKLKWKSNWNYIKTNLNLIWKHQLNEISFFKNIKFNWT